MQGVEFMVKHPFWEGSFAALIVANTLIMIAEAQYDGLAMGHTVGFRTYDTPKASIWPGARRMFDTCEIVFGVIFTVEIILKVVGLRSNFVRDVWNGIDTLIVLCWFISTLGVVHLPVDPMILRLARLVRLLRLLRLVRTIKGFDALYLMTTAMRGSMGVLFWSATLLLVVQVMMALFLQMMLEPFLLSEDTPQPMKDEVFMYYGTFARATLTMFEITLGNWMPPCRALVENVHEGYMLFSLGHKLVIGFSVVTVITGVFIQETFKVATSDDKIMMMQKERAIKTSKTKMQALFEHADVDGDGQIGIEEFRHVMDNQQVRVWLSSMELDVPNIDLLFSMLDKDGSGEITLDELVSGFGRLRGQAKTIDLMMLHAVLGKAEAESFQATAQSVFDGNRSDNTTVHAAGIEALR